MGIGLLDPHHNTDNFTSPPGYNVTTGRTQGPRKDAFVL
jgi:hypothetical protein